MFGKSNLYVAATGRLLALSAFLASPAAQAQFPDDDLYIAGIPEIIVSSATRLPQTLSASPSAITVIDREMIEASGFTNLADLFRLVPGMQVGYFNGNFPSVTYHGLADQYSRRLQILVDNRSVYIPSFGGVPWSDLPVFLEDIERIEVIRGPNAATYGTNSFQAVINIITRHSVQTQGLSLSQIAGQDGLVRSFGRYGGSENGLSYRIDAAHREDEGFENVNDSQHLSQMSARLDYRINQSDSLMAQLGYSGGERERGGGDELLDPERDERIRSHYQLLRFERNGGRDQQLALQFSHNYHNTDDPVDYSPLVVEQRGLRSEAWDLELELKSRPLPELRVVWGAGAHSDRIRSPYFFNASETESNHIARLFGHGEWQLGDHWLLNAGAMVERNGITGTDLSPHIALNWLPSAQHTLRLSYSRATRTPVLFEERVNSTFLPLNAPQFVSSGGLKPETISALELGYVGRFPHLNLTVELKAFREQIDHYINNQPDPATLFPFDFFNLASPELRGFEAWLDWRPSNRTRLVLGYARLKIDVETLADAPLGRNIESSAPRHSGSLLAIVHLADAWDLSAGYYYLGPMEFLEAANPQDGQQRIDARLAKQWQSGGSQYQFALVGQSLSGDYQDFSNSNRFDTRFYLQFSVSLL